MKLLKNKQLIALNSIYTLIKYDFKSNLVDGKVKFILK